MSQTTKVHVYSFSYHGSGIPEDPTGHGGGFVFDCRVLPNPGREERYREMTGKDAAVAAYLEKREEVRRFWDRVSGLVEDGVRVYRDRGLADLTVAFGCTGGRHRSVFFAEKLGRFLAERGVPFDLVHCDTPEDGA